MIVSAPDARAGDADGLVPRRRVADVMGTVASLAAWAPPNRVVAVDAALVRALAWLREVDDRFTTWRPGSEWLRYVEGELLPEEAHPDIAEVVAMCNELAIVTAGAFAIDADPCRPPDPAAYVKGWSGQRAADLLVEAGAAKVCLYLGGDIVVHGGERPWRIGIQSPFTKDELVGVIELDAGAVATSGRYERGAHLYEPVTHAPATSFASVTVVGPDLGLADAYSTAAFAAGDDARTWLPTLDGYSAHLIRPDGSTESLGLELIPPPPSI